MQELTVKDYHPIQPTVSSNGGEVVYTEFKPHLRLQPYIHCYWLLESTQALSRGFRYRVVADGCMDIYFNLDDPQQNAVTGFCKTFTDFALENTFRYVGVRFLPGMFPQLFPVKASELLDRSEALHLVVPSLSSAIERHFKPSLSTRHILLELDRLFLQCLSQAVIDLDPRVYRALGKIVQCNGLLRIERDLDTGLSPRQMRRMFDHYIGASPKSFSKVVRFQKLLQETSSQNPGEVTDLGYYDQPHLIKDFKNFYGSTPLKATRD